MVTDLAKAILEDGQIRDEELTEAKGVFRDCLEDAGLIVNDIGNDGSLDVFLPSLDGESDDQTGARAQALTQACRTNSDWELIIGLYTLVKMNPDNRDPYEVMAECLVRVGIRPDGYSSSDYAEEYESGKILQEYESPDASDEAKRFWECNSDPSNAN